MEVGRRRDGRQAEDFLKVGSYGFEKVSEFKYPGTTIIQSNSIEKDWNGQVTYGGNLMLWYKDESTRESVREKIPRDDPGCDGRTELKRI